MREVIAGECPVGIHGAEVLDLELDQRTGQVGIVSQLVGEGVSLKFEATAQDVHQKLDDGIQRPQNVGEQEESDDDGVLSGETKV